MPRLPIVLVHGYSDMGASFRAWRDLLQARGYDATTIHIGNYVSLSNEVTIKDIAEGFDRALRERAGLKPDEPFDAIVHSTGMLVVREWLVAYASRNERLKHLIGLAPATFGSPMAHKGRSWLGAIFKGGKEPGPDFMEAGDLVLAGLELGSRYTWDLAHKDFLNDTAVYGPSSRTPYPFIIIGLKDYGWLKRVVTEPGTDGTVRWAGAGFNVRKIIADLTVDPTSPGVSRRMQIQPWRNLTVPLIFSPDVNHGTILQAPTDDVVSMVLEALETSSKPTYDSWCSKWEKKSKDLLKTTKARRWQQFVTHAVDERGDGIRDYFLEVGTIKNGTFSSLPFGLDVHAYRDDPSYRCFHVDLDRIGTDNLERLALRVIAESGTELVSYQGYSSSPSFTPRKRDEGKWDAVIEFDATIGSKEVQFFWPYTTTLVEIRMDREPMPLKEPNNVFWFGSRDGGRV